MHKIQLHFSPKYFYLEYIDYRSEHMQQSDFSPPPTPGEGALLPRSNTYSWVSNSIRIR